MNLLTYASPVGIRPHRLWAISLFRKTRTHANFARRKTGVLQQLTTAHASLTHILGGTSAADPGVDKAAKCAAHGFPWSEGPNSDAFGACGEKLLPECYSYLRLTLEGDLLDAGEGLHPLAQCILSLSKRHFLDMYTDHGHVSHSSWPELNMVVSLP